MENPLPPRMNRRAAIRWMVAASASLTLLNRNAFALDGTAAVPSPATGTPATGAAKVTAVGYGTDPDLLKNYSPGDLWPLTLSEDQRKTTAALCDVIIPADEHSPSASQVKVHDFIDEWISAPYPNHDKDRAKILTGLVWIDAEGQKRFSKNFAELADAQKAAICDDIAYVGTATSSFMEATLFFTLFRNLTSGGFYTTAEGMKDLQYVGNTPSATFEGPPPEALRKVGLL